MKQSWTVRATIAVVAAGALLVLAGCAQTDAKPESAAVSAKPAASASVKPTPTPTPAPSPTPPPPPPMQLESVEPPTGAIVGVAMPISIVFSQPVATSARAAIEKAITVTTSTPVTGAWHWFTPQRVDFRPTTFWKSGTKVSMTASFTGVSNGNGRVGTQAYTTDFTIGADIESHVYADKHLMVVTQNGQVLRSMPADTGYAEWPTWNGTMAVIDKSREVTMTSCSVGIACSPSNPNYYDVTLPWDVHLTFSGTYVHYDDSTPGDGGSHGCIHLSYANAEWFYNLSKMGDPVTVSGSTAGEAAGNNGYADYNLSWTQWLAGSATGQFTTSA